MGRLARCWSTRLVVLVVPLALALGVWPSAPVAEETGRALIQKLGCPVCHDLPGHETPVRQEAPDVTFEGDRVQREWLFAFLKSPKTIRPGIEARMPDFRLTDEEALALTDALRSFRDPAAAPRPGARPWRGTVSAEARAAAQRLMSKEYLDCFNCHWDGDRKPAGQKAEWAPDLARVAERLDPDWIVRWLSDPAKLAPNTKMPAFFADATSGPDDILDGDETAQILALRDFLMGRAPAARTDPGYARARADWPEANVALGRSLLVRLNCVGCHSLAGFPRGKRVGPPLGFQGSRVTREWLQAFLKRPSEIKPEYAIMGSGARMPDFRLSDGEVQALTDYIMQTLRDPDLRPLPADSLDPALAAEGARLFTGKSCDNCHRIGSRPGGIGPDLSRAGARLSPAWIYKFVLNPSHYLDTRMPNLNLTEAEARAVTAYLMRRERVP